MLNWIVLNRTDYLHKNGFCFYFLYFNNIYYTISCKWPMKYKKIGKKEVIKSENRIKENFPFYILY